MAKNPSPSSENKASAKKLGYVGRSPNTSRDSNAWFTPVKYIEAARVSLGGVIVLDPFSSQQANKVVKAKKYFTEKEDAFKQDWGAALYKYSSSGFAQSVFMNPPYSGALCAKAVTQFLDEWEKKSFTAGVFLVNNATETKWFQRTFALATAVCFTNHRISFWNADGKAISGNTRGQAFFYFGDNPALFKEAFQDIGATFLLKTPIVS